MWYSGRARRKFIHFQSQRKSSHTQEWFCPVWTVWSSPPWIPVLNWTLLVNLILMKPSSLKRSQRKDILPYVWLLILRFHILSIFPLELERIQTQMTQKLKLTHYFDFSIARGVCVYISAELHSSWRAIKPIVIYYLRPLGGFIRWQGAGETWSSQLLRSFPNSQDDACIS